MTRASPPMHAWVWLLSFAGFAVAPLAGFVTLSPPPGLSPIFARGLNRAMLMRDRIGSVGPSMVFSPYRSSAANLDGLNNFPGVPLDLMGRNRTSTEWQMESKKTTTSSLYGNWRQTAEDAPEELTPEGLPKAARGRMLDQVKPPTLIVTRRTGMRGRPRSQPKASVKPALTEEFVLKAAQVLIAHGGKMDSNLFGQHWKQLHPDTPVATFKSHPAATLHGMLSESPQTFKVLLTERKKVKMFDLVGSNLKRQAAAGADTASVLGNDLSAIKMLLQQSAKEEQQSTLKKAGRPKGKNSRKQGMQPVPSFELEQAQLAEIDDYNSIVPAQGRARNTLHFDRRTKKKKKPTLRQNLQLVVEEEMPAKPIRSAGDAVLSAAVQLYNSWALDGRDVVMEATHGACVEEMIEIAIRENLKNSIEFTAIDAGCGNGWATRILARHDLCQSALGVDAAELMIKRAEMLDELGEAEYRVKDIHEWVPGEPVDVVIANEVLYLLDEPERAVQHIVGKWMKPGGRFVAGLDCYKENKLSHTWAEDLNVPMHCLPENTWMQIFIDSGLGDIEIMRSHSPGPWAGSLIIKGSKPL